jgi:hypothetical protein
MVNYILAADTVPYGFVPQAAALVAGHKLIVDPPPKYAFSPQAASLTFGRQIVADPPVSFGFAPQAATLAVGHKLMADAVAFGFAPQAVTASVGQGIAADPVVFGFSPQDAVLARGYVLDAEPVTFTADPQDVVMAVLMHTLFADAVVFDFAPQSATATPSITPLVAEPFDLPEFNLQTAWTVSINNDFIIFAGFSPVLGAFFVRYTDGGFSLWLRQPQGVMRGLLLAPDQRLFLQNLGRPFLASS